MTKNTIWLSIIVFLLTACKPVQAITTSDVTGTSTVPVQKGTPSKTMTPLSTTTKTPVPTYFILRLEFEYNALTISEVFEKYGMPDEIWLSSTGKVPILLPTYIEVILFYPNEQMLFHYWSKAEQWEKNGQYFITICASQYDDTTIENFVTAKFVWNRHVDVGFEDFPALPEHSDVYWKLLSDVTDTNTDKFYKKTLNDPKGACITTPAELWPNPNK